MRPAVVILLVCPALAAGQDRTLLYVNPAPLVTSSRLVALGGAAVGLAENSESLPFSYAAAAHRNPHRTRGWDWDLTAALLFSPWQDMRDVDNEGTPLQATAPLDSQLGGLIQFARFGIGAYTRLSRRSICIMVPCGPQQTLNTSATQGSIVFAFNAVKDQLTFAAGFFLASAAFDVGGTVYEYRGWNVGGSMLWRPNFLPFRIGIHGVSQTTGAPQFNPNTVPSLNGRTVFTGVIAPARIFIGASARFGEGAWRYNRLSASALKELPDDFNFAEVPHDLDPDDPRPPGRFLVTVQLDVILPVRNATTLGSFLNNTAATPTGETLGLVPRAGFEVEVIDHRLRLRTGGYLEPPFIQGSMPRPHLTFGTELLLFKLLMDWSVSASADVANKYLSMSFGIGWWG